MRLKIISIFLIIILVPSLSNARQINERVIVKVSDYNLLQISDSLKIDIDEAYNTFNSLLEKVVEKKLTSIQQKGVKFHLIDLLTFTMHGAIIELYQPIESIKSIDTSIKTYPDSILEINLEKSSNLIRADEVHKIQTDSGEFLTGKGVTVAVIDTGVDYTHPDLGGTIGFGQKILKGYDFVDNDEDPMDIDGHGTEVAGIISANGRVKGIAPDSNIIAYRVVDRMGNVKSSDLIRALEMAAKDGADVINLSLGTREELGAVTYAINNLVSGGIVVVAANGNSAERSFGEPAGRKNVIAVGASLNNVTSTRDAEIIINPNGYELIAAYMNGSKPSPQGVTGELVYAKYAREEDVYSLDLQGKIVLAERGGDTGEIIYFSEKEQNVASKGALGLIIYNQEGGVFIGNLIGSHNPLGYLPQIPVVSISKGDGEYLRDSILNEKEIEATIITNKSAQIGIDRVAVFSSIGPVSSFYIKPDLVAPGVAINTTSIGGGYTSVDGTSFAAPHVSGAAALIIQKYPELDNTDVMSILKTTSKVLTDQWKEVISSFVQGSGRLDVLSAISSNLIMKPHSLVFHVAPNQNIDTKQLTIIPIDGNNISATIDISWNHNSNISLIPEFHNFKIIENQIENISIKASLINAESNYYEGRLNLLTEFGFTNYTIPIIVYVNDFALQINNEEELYDISIELYDSFLEAHVNIIFPNGVNNVYSVNSGESIKLPLKVIGEYWVEANILTPEGNLFARRVFSVNDSSTDYINFPYRFFQIYLSFIVIFSAVSMVIIMLNRRKW